jgi:hypothetical protein
MKLIKDIIVLILSIGFGSGIWYVVFWFISNEPDLFTWHWVTKVVYLILAASTSQGIYEGLTKNS